MIKMSCRERERERVTVAHGANPGDEAPGATAVANGDEPRETTTRRLPGFWRSSKRGRVGEMPDQPGWRNDYANCPHWTAGGLSTSQTADGRPHGSFQLQCVKTTGRPLHAAGKQ